MSKKSVSFRVTRSITLTYRQAYRFALKVAYKRLYNGRNNIEVVNLIHSELQTFLKESKRRKFSIDGNMEKALVRIRDTVCDYFQVSKSEFEGDSRKQQYVRARQAACLLGYQLSTTNFMSVVYKVPRVTIQGRKDKAVIRYEYERKFREDIITLSNRLCIPITKTHDNAKSRRERTSIPLRNPQREISTAPV